MSPAKHRTYVVLVDSGLRVGDATSIERWVLGVSVLPALGFFSADFSGFFFSISCTDGGVSEVVVPTDPVAPAEFVKSTGYTGQLCLICLCRIST